MVEPLELAQCFVLVELVLHRGRTKCLTQVEDWLFADGANLELALDLLVADNLVAGTLAADSTVVAQHNGAVVDSNMDG